MSGKVCGRTARGDDEMSHTQYKDTQIGGTHYASKKVQPWHAMEAWMTREQFAGFLRGNAIKYLARCDDKGGLEDLKKARHYLDKLIEFHECSNALGQATGAAFCASSS